MKHTPGSQRVHSPVHDKCFQSFTAANKQRCVMDFSQCNFCTYINAAFAPQCELCHEFLSVQNVLLMSELLSMQTNAARYCRRCARRLHQNQRSCAVCNAHWSSTPIARLSSLENLHQDLISLSVFPVTTVPSSLSQEDAGLSQAARSQFLARVPLDSSCTSALCPVCIEVIAASEDSDVEIVQLPCCRNKFHSACVEPWFRTHSSCPTCRRNLNDMVTN